jgi:SNF2 family DNA or RNA helicase
VKTYGKARLKADGFWHVQLQPNAALVFKRLLGRVAKDSVGIIRVKNTDDVCRDLEWFLQRYPLDVKPLKVLLKRAARHKRNGEVFDELVAGAAQPQHFALAVPPRDYQCVAAECMLRMRSLLVADEMGVGKTASIICALSNPSTRPALVVTPTSIPQQWEDEIHRFCPQLRTHVIKQRDPYDVRNEAGEFPDVLITSYSKLAYWADSIAGKVKTVAFDEIQELRHKGTEDKPVAKYAGAARISRLCDFRWGTSGTPIYNYGEEFLNVISILKPGVLGTRTEFVREWCGRDQKTGKAIIKSPKAFGAYLRDAGLMLRRTRADVGRELPALQRSMLRITADETELLKVDSDVTRFARMILDDRAKPSDKRNAFNQFDWRLRQATGLAKAPAVCALTQMLVENGERVVVFAWHRDVYDLYRKKLENSKPVFYTGSESTNQRRHAKDAFLAGTARVLVISLRTAAGLDGLQHACRNVVFGELDWSPGVHDQCETRVFRDGQLEPVHIYYPLSTTGSDPVVSEVLGLKRWQLEGALDPNADVLVKQVNRSDAVRLLAERYLAKRDARKAA